METTRRGQPDFDYVRFDDRSGRAFVAEHYGARGVAAWDACALPAMRSDVLRLLLLNVHGGVYADATFCFDINLSDLVAETQGQMIPVWSVLAINNLLIFREPKHPFLEACIALLLENIERRRFGSALMATGPGVLNSVRAAISPEERTDILVLGHLNAEWMQWGWADSLAAAERLIVPTEALAAAYRAITLVSLEALRPKARNALLASHRAEDGHWLKWTGSIYR